MRPSYAHRDAWQGNAGEEQYEIQWARAEAWVSIPARIRLGGDYTNEPRSNAASGSYHTAFRKFSRLFTNLSITSASIGWAARCLLDFLENVPLVERQSLCVPQQVHVVDRGESSILWHHVKVLVQHVVLGIRAPLLQSGRGQ